MGVWRFSFILVLKIVLEILLKIDIKAYGVFGYRVSIILELISIFSILVFLGHKWY